MHFSQKLTQQLTLQCTQRSNLGVVHGGFTGIPNGLISSNSTVCRQVHVSFTTIHSSFCINCIHVRKSTCAVMVQWQTLQKEKHPQYSPVISTIQGTGRCQLELWVSASQKKALPVFLEKTATFRIGWMVYKYLAWVCSTCSTSNNIVMNNNILCGDPLGDQHPDHVKQVIAHHTIRPSNHQPWRNQNAAYQIKSCHIVSHNVMAHHVISLAHTRIYIYIYIFVFC